MTRPDRTFVNILFTTLILLLVSGCQAVIHEKGTILDPQAVDRIDIGLTIREEVRTMLGPPTIVNNFRQERWIYIQDRQFKNMQRTFSRAANRLEITFDETGTVIDLKRNFGDALLDPTTLPEAQNEQSWFGWLWGGEYNQPAIKGIDPTQVAETPPERPSPEKKGSNGRDDRDTGPWDPFWRFWPLEDSDSK